MNNSRSPRTRALTAIHLVIAVGVPVIAAILFGCIKPPSINPEDLGTQVSEQEVEREISKAIYGADPRKIEIGQETWYDINMRIENQSEVRPISELNQRVIGRSEDSQALRITVRSQETPANGDPADVKESVIEFKKTPDPASVASLFSQRLGTRAVPGDIYAPFSLEALGQAGFTDVAVSATRDVKKITYHNLKVSNEVISPPDAARARPNCAEVKDCLLPVTKLGYDEAYWFDDNEYEIARYQYTLSKATPYLALIIEKCLSGFITSNGRRYFVRQCEFLRDFKPR